MQYFYAYNIALQLPPPQDIWLRSNEIHFNKTASNQQCKTFKIIQKSSKNVSIYYSNVRLLLIQTKSIYKIVLFCNKSYTKSICQSLHLVISFSVRMWPKLPVEYLLRSHNPPITAGTPGNVRSAFFIPLNERFFKKTMVIPQSVRSESICKFKVARGSRVRPCYIAMHKFQILGGLLAASVVHHQNSAY